MQISALRTIQICYSLDELFLAAFDCTSQNSRFYKDFCLIGFSHFDFKNRIEKGIFTKYGAKLIHTFKVNSGNEVFIV